MFPVVIAAALALSWPAEAPAQTGYQPSRGDSRSVRTFGRVGGGSTGRVTRVGDNRQRSNVYRDMNQQIGSLQGNVQSLQGNVQTLTGQLKEAQATPVPPQAGGPQGAAGVGGGPLPPSGGTGGVPMVLFGESLAGPSWDQRVEEARRRLLAGLGPAPTDALSAPDPTVQVAALEMVEAGRLTASPDQILELLGATRSRPVAELCVEILDHHDSKTIAGLAEHLRQRGPADAQAARLLSQTQTSEAWRALYERASQAAPEDDASLIAIRGIAVSPNPAAEGLLRRLKTDWSPRIQEAALKALTLRRASGIEATPAFRPVPKGKSIEELAKETPRGTRRNASSGDFNWSTGSPDSGVRRGGREDPEDDESDYEEDPEPRPEGMPEEGW